MTVSGLFGTIRLAPDDPRKDTAVHVSLSSDEIVKQRSRDLPPRSTHLAACYPHVRKTETNPISQPNLPASPVVDRRQKQPILTTPSSRKERIKHRLKGQTNPTRKPSGVAVGDAASRGTGFHCQTVSRKKFRPPRSNARSAPKTTRWAGTWGPALANPERSGRRASDGAAE